MWSFSRGVSGSFLWPFGDFFRGLVLLVFPRNVQGPLDETNPNNAGKIPKITIDLHCLTLEGLGNLMIPGVKHHILCVFISPFGFCAKFWCQNIRASSPLKKISGGTTQLDNLGQVESFSRYVRGEISQATVWETAAFWNIQFCEHKKTPIYPPLKPWPECVLWQKTVTFLRFSDRVTRTSSSHSRCEGLTDVALGV